MPGWPTDDEALRRLEGRRDRSSRASEKLTILDSHSVSAIRPGDRHGPQPWRSAPDDLSRTASQAPRSNRTRLGTVLPSRRDHENRFGPPDQCPTQTTRYSGKTSWLWPPFTISEQE